MVSNGIDLIAAERQRQIEKEGYFIEDDARYTQNELIQAAMCYLWAAEHPEVVQKGPPAGWPWGSAWWKPSKDGPQRNLEKAGALIAAEIDRLKFVSEGT